MGISNFSGTVSRKIAKDLFGRIVLGQKKDLNHDMMAQARNFYRLDLVVARNRGTPINISIDPSIL